MNSYRTKVPPKPVVHYCKPRRQLFVREGTIKECVSCGKVWKYIWQIQYVNRPVACWGWVETGEYNILLAERTGEYNPASGRMGFDA